ncbi:MAG: hypothetical protein QM831_46640 [Kofleriaceae bacterium]
MGMRIVGALLLLSSPALADSFGGFSSIDAPYLVNQDRVCSPLAVADGKAVGAPQCQKASTDDIAHLTVKPGVIQSGAKATYAATASGKTLTVTKDGSPAVVWSTLDPIGKVVDVFASQYEDRVAVTYTTRALGKETTNVVAFAIVKTTGRDPGLGSGSGSSAPGNTPPVGTPPKEDPAITKAVDAARKAPRAKVLAAWQAVQAADPDHAEARYRIAALQIGAKQTAAAVTTLEELAKSQRADAIEWLIEARFDPAFAGLRADPKFRVATGLDKKGASGYERVMGFGGQWEQTGTSCDTPEIRLTMKRDRSFKLNVKSSCEGHVYDIPFKGSWRLDDNDHVTLVIPTKGQAASAKDEAPCTLKKHGEEDAMHCNVGKDLEFEVLPTRR